MNKLLHIIDKNLGTLATGIFVILFLSSAFLGMFMLFYIIVSFLGVDSFMNMLIAIIIITPIIIAAVALYKERQRSD